jgi:hypothetical protein
MALLLMKLVASLKYQVMETTYRESTTWFFCPMIHCLIFFEQMTMKLFKMDSIPPWSATIGTSIHLSTLPPGGKISKKEDVGWSFACLSCSSVQLGSSPSRKQTPLRGGGSINEDCC